MFQFLANFWAILLMGGLLLVGYIFGRRAEKRHYKSILRREDELRHLVVIPGRILPSGFASHKSCLVQGNVVIAQDYFKVTVANLRNLVGGRLTAYESLLDRARREAVLRMQEEARECGAEAVFNLKFESSSLSSSRGKGGLSAIEVLAYGTALTPPSG